MKNVSSNKGLSLVEFLIYFSIFTAIAIVLVNVFLMTTRGRGQVVARSEVQQNLRSGLLRITQAIHNATGVNGSYPSSTLSLIMPTSATNPTVFDVSSGILRITEGTGTAQTLMSSKTEITSITFTKISNAVTIPPTAAAKVSIQTDISMKYKDNGNPQLKYSQREVRTSAINR